jgi:hypothetical protein
MNIVAGNVFGCSGRVREDNPGLYGGALKGKP